MSGSNVNISNVSITYYNINGLHSRTNGVRCNKLNDQEFITNINSDIVCLAETHCKSQNSHEIQFNGYTTFSVCRPNLKKKGSGGLAVLIKKHLRPGIKFEKIISTDFIFFKMCKKFFSMPEDVYICAVYLPPINSSYTQKDQNVSLFDILEDEISKYCCKAQVILLGDLNARVNVKDKDYIQHDEISHNQLPQCYIADNIYYSRNSQDRGPTNDQGKQLLNFCIGTRMRMLNGRTLGDTKGRLTCHHYNGSSTVDWCLVSSEFLDSILYFRVNEFLTLSDHCPITVGIRACSTSLVNDSKAELFPLPTQIKWNEKIALQFKASLYSEKIQSKIKSFVLSVKDADTAANFLTNVLYDCLASCKIHVKKKISKNRKKRHKRWFDEDCIELKRNMQKQARMIRIQNGSLDSVQRFFAAKKKFKKCVKRKHLLYKNKLVESLNMLESKNPQAFWKTLDEIQNLDSQPKENNDALSPEEWLAYFKDLMCKNVKNCRTPSYTPNHNVYSQDKLDAVITNSEIMKAVSSLKNKKASGHDGITNEIIKTSMPELVQCYKHLFNLILVNGQFPDCWRNNLIKPLHKGGDLNDPSNYRGIAMSSCLSKLFCKILDSRLQAYLEEYDIINRCQIGFRPKSRTSDHILVLTSIINKFISKKKYLFTCFIDLKKGL